MARMTHELHNKAHEQAPLLVPGGGGHSGAEPRDDDRGRRSLYRPYAINFQLRSRFRSNKLL